MYSVLGEYRNIPQRDGANGVQPAGNENIHRLSACVDIMVAVIVVDAETENKADAVAVALRERAVF